MKPSRVCLIIILSGGLLFILTLLILRSLENVIEWPETYNTEWKIKPEFDKIQYWTTDIKKIEDLYNIIGKNNLIDSKWFDKIHNNKLIEKLNINESEMLYYSYDNFNILPVIEKLDEYCLKTNFLCDSYGIILVKNNILMKDISMPKSINYDGPIKEGEYIKNEQIQELTTKLINTPLQKELSTICPAPDAGEAEADVKKGIIIEELFSNIIEIKVICVLGQPCIFFIPTSYVGNDGHKLLHNNDMMDKLKSMCKKIVNYIGIDFIRIDFIITNNTIHVGELTMTPYPIYGISNIVGPKRYVPKYLKKLNEYYKDRSNVL